LSRLDPQQSSSIEHTTARLRRSLSFAVALFVLAGLLTSCAKEVSGPQGSCSPSYTVDSVYGRLTVQQRGPGQSIQWGIQPKVSYNQITVSVFVGSRRVDGKTQTYDPHGSISTRDFRSGDLVTIEGTAKDDRGTLIFKGYCKAA
jgi:hypothetical protein